MADILIKLEELKRLDDGVHLFCPRSTADDDSYFLEEDLSDQQDETKQARMEREGKIKEWKQRQEDVLEACMILAFDGEDALPYQKDLKRRLRIQLTRCDICVRQFHRARRRLKEKLDEDYPSDEVRAFLEKFDAMNISRITAGLDELTSALEKLPQEKRSILAAGEGPMYAMFEALNCAPFLRDTETLERCFDKPFQLAQQRRKLKLPSYVPAMTAFLFSNVPERHAWGVLRFKQMKRAPNDNEFRFAVQPFLEAAATRVHVANIDYELLPRFWSGVRLIVDKLNEHLVTECLVPMEINIYSLSLDLFQVPSTHFGDLVACYKRLLEISPSAFWEQMGAASPQNVIEQICNSPMLDTLLRDTVETEPLHLEEKLEWATLVIDTVKPATNLVSPLQTLLGQMLHRFQGDQYSRYARKVTFTKGLACLLQALKIVRKDVPGGPVCTKLIELVSKEHGTVLLQELDGIEKKEEIALDNVELNVLDIVEEVLALEVQSLAHDRREVTKKPGTSHKVEVSSLHFWKLTLQHIRPGHAALPIAVLSGITGLLSLEKLAPSEIKIASNKADSWNDALSRVLNEVGDLLERLETFALEPLEELFSERKGSRGIISLLLNADERLRQPALGILKTLSGQSGRRESILHVLQAYLPSVLNAFVFSFDMVSQDRTFAPCPILVKLGADVYSCLCDSQDGLLRSSEPKASDKAALRELWRSTWLVLNTMFRKTESWSVLGHDKTMMQDFCRDTMDFAESAFDQYAIIAEALREHQSQQSRIEVRKELLEQPNQVFESILKWLRLRDEYLITRAVSLTVKILKRLFDVGLQVSPESARYLESILATDKTRTKTNLSTNQKAELQRALESNSGKLIKEEEVSGKDGSRSRKQGSLQDWVTSGRDSGSSTPVSGNEQSSRALVQQRKTQTSTAPKQSVSAATEYAAMRKQEEAKAFLAKRQAAKAEQEKQKQAARAKTSANLGAGSGVIGLGNLGNEHVAKGQNVMVSSDESEDDEEDDDLAELFGSHPKPKKKVERPNVDPNGAIGLKIEQKQGPTRIQRAQRSMKDMRARLAPDLTPLHRVILNWDFFHNGDFPPNSDEGLFSKVSNSFRDPTSYQQTFEPLLTLEAWQGMVRSREEIDANNSKPYEIKIQNRSTVDSFMEVSSMLDSTENKRLGLSEGDIILFSKARKPTEDSSSPHCLSRIYRIKRQKAMLEIVYQVPPTSSLAPHLAIQSIIYGIKVQSITPLEREFGALKALQYYDLCNQIVRAKPSHKINYSEKQISATQDVWNVNRAQSEAINAALENDGFSLIQGPPGSGKTKTIVAIVGGLLTKVLDSASAGATKISMPKANGNPNTSSDGPSKKLLLCAPSNAAVDELVMRLKTGVRTKNGRQHELNVVRIGRSEAINAQVKDVTMEELVSRRLGNNENDAQKRQQSDIFIQHKQVSTELKESMQSRDQGELKGAELSNLESTITQLRKRKNELSIKIDNLKDQERNAGRQAELDRKRAQQAVLDGAHVICATLSGSGHDMFQGLNIEFETVIIDEAAQCVEMSSLIPLKYGCVKCIMVGDPKQLPPTVFSKEAARFQYEQSLFVRMQNNYPGEIHLLDTQYRMHPSISLFPSRAFYDGLLKDGQGMAGLRKQPWHSSALLAPYRFYDVQGHQQSAPRGRSYINTAEIDVAMALYQRLKSDFDTFDFAGKIGVITPYKAQLNALKDRFASRYGSMIVDDIEFNTTDAFQGRESEIIIFSCVRASDGGGIGFLQDIRRMNVGLTRAKSSLWVLGNSSSLIKGQYWRKLVEDAQARDCYTTGNVLSLLSKTSSNFPLRESNDTSMADITSRDRNANHNGKAGSANGPRQRVKGVEAVDGRQTQTGRGDPDRMEGVQYRFEDRVSKAKSQPGPSVEHESSSTAIETTEDVEMTEGDQPISRTGGTPRDEPRIQDVSGVPDTTEQSNSSVAVQGAHNPKNAGPPPHLPSVARKRAAPSPFMPKKKAKPPGR